MSTPEQRERFLRRLDGGPARFQTWGGRAPTTEQFFGLLDGLVDEIVCRLEEKQEQDVRDAAETIRQQQERSQWLPADPG